jgi:hypothetical protein
MSKSSTLVVGTKLNDWQGSWPVLCVMLSPDPDLYDSDVEWLVSSDTYNHIILDHSENSDLCGRLASTEDDVVVIDWFDDEQHVTLSDCVCPDLLNGHYFGCVWNK